MIFKRGTVVWCKTEYQSKRLIAIAQEYGYVPKHLDVIWEHNLKTISKNVCYDVENGCLDWSSKRYYEMFPDKYTIVPFSEWLGLDIV